MEEWNGKSVNYQIAKFKVKVKDKIAITGNGLKCLATDTLYVSIYDSNTAVVMEVLIRTSEPFGAAFYQPSISYLVKNGGRSRPKK